MWASLPDYPKKQTGLNYFQIIYRCVGLHFRLPSFPELTKTCSKHGSPPLYATPAGSSLLDWVHKLHDFRDVVVRILSVFNDGSLPNPHLFARTTLTFLLDETPYNFSVFVRFNYILHAMLIRSSPTELKLPSFQSAVLDQSFRPLNLGESTTGCSRGSVLS